MSGSIINWKVEINEDELKIPKLFSVSHQTQNQINLLALYVLYFCSISYMLPRNLGECDQNPYTTFFILHTHTKKEV